MKVKKENIVELNHVLESGKENFPFESSFRDVVELDPNGNARAHAEDVWYIESEVRMHSHVGTHVEVPFHHKFDGPDCAQYPVERLVGEAFVIDCTGKKAGDFITLEEIKRYEERLEQGDMILFYTGFDKKFHDPDWEPFPHVEKEAILWLLEKFNPPVIGTDASGIEVPDDDRQPNHTNCFENNTAIIESLTNLESVKEERITLFVLPLRMKRVDSCAVRVIAIRDI